MTICPICGTEFFKSEKFRYLRKYCSPECKEEGFKLYLKNRKLAAKGLLGAEAREKELKTRRVNSRNYRKNLKKRRNKIFGTRCILCNSTRNLLIHRIDGTPHKSSSMPKCFKDPENWRLLCLSCHKVVHYTMKYFGWAWEDFIAHFQKV